MGQVLNFLLKFMLAFREVIAFYALAKYKQKSDNAEKELELTKDAKKRDEEIQKLSDVDLDKRYNDWS